MKSIFLKKFLNKIGKDNFFYSKIRRCENMLKFCNDCGAIMLPSKNKNKKVLVCTLCKKTIHIDDDIIAAYTF